MGGTLAHIMSVGNESLRNSRLGVEVSGHNIANAHTKGYSRQRVNTEMVDPMTLGRHTVGGGARVSEIQRGHDKYIEMQLRKENQEFGYNNKLEKNLSKLESVFSPESESGISERLTDFQNSLRELSNYPEEQSVRINVTETARSLTQGISESHKSIKQIQENLTDEARGEFESLNHKLAEVAKLNLSIKEMSYGPNNRANDLEDRRDSLLREITEAIDCNVYLDENDNYAIRGPGSSLLVDGIHASTIKMEATRESNEPKFMLYGPGGGNPMDITSKCKKGYIGAILTARDYHAQNARDQLNNLAFNLGSSFNSIHQKGFGINSYESQSGRDFFKGHDYTNGEPADAITLDDAIFSDPSSISAAFTKAAPGDNIIANELIKFFKEPLFENGKTSVFGIYENLQSKIGLDSANSRDNAKTSNIVMSQLESQREAVAGVSVDEEAAELLKYQHMFTASSRLITTADEMFKTILDLKR